MSDHTNDGVLKLRSPNLSHEYRLPASIRPAPEVTARDAHERRYTSAQRTSPVVVQVDDYGIVKVSEEALHHLLVSAGWTEVADHADGSGH